MCENMLNVRPRVHAFRMPSSASNGTHCVTGTRLRILLNTERESVNAFLNTPTQPTNLLQRSSTALIRSSLLSVARIFFELHTIQLHGTINSIRRLINCNANLFNDSSNYF